MKMESYIRKKKVVDDRILLSPIESLREFNFGLFLVAVHFIFEFGSLQGMFPIINVIKLPLIVSSLTIIYAVYLLVRREVDLKSDTTKKFILLCVFIIVYSLIATELPEYRYDNAKIFLIYLSHYIIIVTCLKKPSQFILLIDIWILAIAISSFHGIMQGGKIWGNRWLKDENHISLVVATAIPFALILYREFKFTVKKAFYVMALTLYVSVNVIAASRGGALSMIIVAFLSWLLFKNKMRIMMIMMVAVFLVLSYAPPHFFEEMQTLEQGTEEGTADDRIYLWGFGIEMFIDHPILGVGPTNYPVVFSDYEQGERYPIGERRVPHSTPVQWLAETGMVGVILFLLLFKALYKNWKLAGVLKRHPKYELNSEKSSIFVSLTHACAISQVGFWFGALFLSLMPYPFYWILVPFSEIWKNMTRNEINRLDKLELEVTENKQV